MEHSIFLAQLLGLYLIIVTGGLLMNIKNCRKIMDGYCENEALLYLGGMVGLIAGLLIVLSHNRWVTGWPVLITLLGWMSTLKGAFLMFFPNQAKPYIASYRNSDGKLIPKAVAMFCVGLFLCYKGFFQP